MPSTWHSAGDWNTQLPGLRRAGGGAGGGGELAGCRRVGLLPRMGCGDCPGGLRSLPFLPTQESCRLRTVGSSPDAPEDPFCEAQGQV